MDSYHHGSLRQALIDATESLLADKGPEAFSLREVARRAGVSPAAPAHHFGDASGLLTAVATIGFDGLASALREGEARGGRDPRRCLREQGIAYVAFAMRFPGRFRLMFRDALRANDPELQRAGNDAFGVLEDGVRAAFEIPPGRPLGAKAWTALLALWSAVHGYAHLTIAGRLDALTGPQGVERGTGPQGVERGAGPQGVERGAEGAGREAFVAATLRPVLDCVVRGCVPEGPRSRRQARR